MKLWSLPKSAARNLFRQQQVESQLEEELHAYVDLVTQERIAAGIAPSEARRTALAEFGGVEQVKQAVRNHRAGVGLEVLGQDIHTTPLNADLYTAIQASRDGEGGGTNSSAITRLRDGSSWQEADAQINRAWSHRAARYELRGDPGAQVSYYSVPLQKGETDALRPQVVTLIVNRRELGIAGGS
jgi:hypothetical protein